MELTSSSIFNACINVSLLLFFMTTAAPDVCEASSITRLQYRESETSEKNLALSHFNSFKNDFYLLGLYECRCKRTQNESFESYLGFRGFSNNGLKSPLGIASRHQRWDSEDSSSLGVEYVFNHNSSMSNFLKKSNIHTFVQLFIKEGYRDRGNIELQHYYNIKGLFSYKTSIRGYNNLYISAPGRDKYIYNGWFDYIYSLSDEFDLLIRISYLSDELPQTGIQGATFEYGFRFNM